LDLFGANLKTVQQRVEAKDYVDMDALLQAGLTLERGIAAAQALYPDLNPLWTAKTLSWFEDDLAAALPTKVKARLTVAAADCRLPLRRIKLKSRSLLPAR